MAPAKSSKSENFSIVFLKPISENHEKCYDGTVQSISSITEDTIIELNNNLINQTDSSIECQLERVIFQNDYIVKFNGNFTIVDFNYRNFIDYLERLWKLVIGSHHHKSIIIEFVPNFVKEMNRLLFRTDAMLRTPSLWSNYERVDIGRFNLGSLINLSKYVSHFSVVNQRSPCFTIVTTNGTQQQRQDWFSPSAMKLEIRYQKELIGIYFQLDSSSCQIFKLSISFAMIKTILIEDLTKSSTNRLFIDLFHSPLLYYADLDNPNFELNQICDLNVHWRRTNNFNNNFNNNNKKRCPQFEPHLFGLAKSLCIELASFDTDQTTTVAQSSPGNKSSRIDLFQKLIYIANVCKGLNKNFNFYLGNVELTNSSIDFERVQRLLFNRRFPFSVYYACLTLFTTSYKISDELNECHRLNDYIDVIEQESKNGDRSVVEQALYHLKNHYNEHCISNIYERLVTLITDHKACLAGKGLVHSDFVLIRKAVLTPSHLELFPPVPLQKSRFSNLVDMDHSIRLTVLDDNGRPLNSLNQSSEFQFVQAILQRKLLTGLLIGDRCYEFLGSSSSQMRENGVIFYSKDNENRTVSTIRSMAGDLSKFNNYVAKYMARFGLMFSQAMGHFEVDQSQVIFDVPDFVGDVKPNFKEFINLDRDTYVFSDGVGLISSQFAEKIANSLKLKSAKCLPSALQIRYGGCKGVLVVYTLTKPIILFRKSMCKYQSDSCSLGILKYSAPRPVYLNRPLINILDQLQVMPQIFYEFFHQATTMVAKASLHEAWAKKLVDIYSASYLPYDQIYASGISLLNEPFFREIINYLIYYRLNELKSKARIRIPYANGRSVFGVVDESQELKYGEIFLQYTVMDAFGHSTDETVILDGEVMVTKFPCLQPGDVRKLRAVSDLERIGRLVHIKDCIVFPSCGPRPHPDEMAGSDLDGDEYAVFWNTELIFPVKNLEPMQFPYGIAQRLLEPIKEKDIVDFYCNYLLYNNIGRVANCHLMFSDVHPKGLFSEGSHELAIQFSIAVDYQKTGIFKMLSSKYRISIRPDFMESFISHRVYLSKRILGQFYRHCCLVEKVIELSQIDQFLTTNHMVRNPRFVLKGWKKFEKEAEEAFLEYKLRIVELLEQLDIENEIVLLCDVYDDRKRLDVSEVLIRDLFSYFRAKFRRQASQLETREDRLLLISAWYSIVFEKCYMYNGKQLLGLPWLITEEMCHLAFELDRFNFDVRSDLQAMPMMVNDGSVTDDLATSNNLSWSFMKEVAPNQLTISEPDMFDLMVGQSYQFKIALRLIIEWIRLIRTNIYQCLVVRKFCFSNSTTSISEDEIFEKYFQEFFQAEIDKLKVSHSTRLELLRSTGQPVAITLPSVSFLFNACLAHLFELCNLSNQLILNGELEKIFLLKYAAFGLGFWNKFDENFERNLRKTHCRKLLNEQKLLKFYVGHVRLLFEKYPTLSQLSKEYSKFYYIFENGNVCFDIRKHSSKVCDTLLYLSGVEFIKISKSCNANILMEDENGDGENNHRGRRDGNRKNVSKKIINGNQSANSSTEDTDLDLIRTKLVPVPVQAIGLLHSIAILRLLLGHPDFGPNIFAKITFDPTKKLPRPSSNRRQSRQNIGKRQNRGQTGGTLRRKRRQTRTTTTTTTNSSSNRNFVIPNNQAQSAVIVARWQREQQLRNIQNILPRSVYDY